MQISLNLNLGQSPDPVALEQLFAWAAKLDVGYDTMQEREGPQAVTALEENKASHVDVVQQPAMPKPNGAAQPEPAPTPGRRGRRGASAAQQTEAIATAGPAIPPGAAIPPGMEQPQVQQPAMPKPDMSLATGANGAATLEDLRACIFELQQKDPKSVFPIMRRKAWADGSEKPSWFTAEAVPADLRDRLIEELMAGGPAA